MILDISHLQTLCKVNIPPASKTDDENLLWDLATTFDAESGNKREALWYYLQLYKLQDSDYKSKTDLDLIFKLISIYERQGDYEIAEIFLLELLEFKSDRAHLWYIKSRLEYFLQKDEECLISLKKGYFLETTTDTLKCILISLYFDIQESLPIKNIFIYEIYQSSPINFNKIPYSLLSIQIKYIIKLIEILIDYLNSKLGLDIALCLINILESGSQFSQKPNYLNDLYGLAALCYFALNEPYLAFDYALKTKIDDLTGQIIKFQVCVQKGYLEEALIRGQKILQMHEWDSDSPMVRLMDILTRKLV